MDSSRRLSVYTAFQPSASRLGQSLSKKSERIIITFMTLYVRCFGDDDAADDGDDDDDDGAAAAEAGNRTASPSAPAL